QFTEVERAREKFSFAYIPEDVELLFREALTCFSQGAFNAFASMCRRSAQAMFADLGEAGRLRLFDELNAVRELADIAPEIFAKLKSVLFGAELDARSELPLLDGYEAGIMLEVAKDLLYEAYVRKGKLQQAIMVRRFFLDETNPNIPPMDQRAQVSAGSFSPKCESVDDAARIAEQRHPPAIFTGIPRSPAILHIAERALRVRHGDGHAA